MLNLSISKRQRLFSLLGIFFSAERRLAEMPPVQFWGLGGKFVPAKNYQRLERNYLINTEPNE